MAAWPAVAEAIPEDSILMGGTALAIHLRHRRSDDLDIFTPGKFDPDPVHMTLDRQGVFDLISKSRGHLHGMFNGVKLDILWNAGALTLQAPTTMANLNVGSVQDIMASKLRAITERHILRDYFDVMCIEQSTDISLEEGLTLYTHKYKITPQHGSVHALVKGLGYFEDVENDPVLCTMVGNDVRDRVVAYFKSRHTNIVRAFKRRIDPL
ncbi:MAG: hypothetical protein OXI96_04870 [Acidimicrobiaceae bacterium]|nr:hypothetical protein [Acidimicrobiaceae bacterium]